METLVVLVDEQDNEIGTMEKMEAHRQGLLHRAFSVIITNSNNEILIQKRALHKYHSPGLWTNTCCSHPFPGESIFHAANRRLAEEMGIHTDLHLEGNFIYKCSFDNGLVEYEFDHILKGVSNNQPKINSDEVHSYQWVSPALLKVDMKNHPEVYTFWFHELVKRGFI